MKKYYEQQHIDCIVNGEIETNTYIITTLSDNSAVIIDPADGPAIEHFLKKKELKPTHIINTHGHYDHISGNLHLKEKYDIPICIEASDAEFLTDPSKNMSGILGEGYRSPEADIILYDGQEFNAGGVALLVRHSPGHTPGSICLEMNNHRFTGDLIFTNGIGRTDLPGGSSSSIFASIRKIFHRMKQDDFVYCGHGDYGHIELFRHVISQFNA